MTNGVKTVKYPRMILLNCGEADRLSEIISDILKFCSYNASVDGLEENTDYIISKSYDDIIDNDGIIADTVLSDCVEENEILRFRRIVTPYEKAAESEESEKKLLTYSAENYSADVTCRNISTQGDSTVFDILSGGILSRVRINSSIYSVSEVLICTSVLIAAGIPLAAILSFFNK